MTSEGSGGARHGIVDKPIDYADWWDRRGIKYAGDATIRYIIPRAEVRRRDDEVRKAREDDSA